MHGIRSFRVIIILVNEADVEGVNVCIAVVQVVLSLEGGYDLAAMCDCAQECVRALVGERVATPPYAELARRPAPKAQRALHAALAHQAPHWPSVTTTASTTTTLPP